MVRKLLSAGETKDGVTGAVVSVAVTATLSSAAADPGVTPVPGNDVNRTSRVFPTVAELDVEIESETSEP